ncbi:MAG TPA: septum formation initiator family protein [Terracidiphilus sp.]|nr:septum formation initiator family protein [Terracidiphilus sp.]
MAAENKQPQLHIPGEAPPAREPAMEWAERVWRPAGTLLAVLLALLVTWHVINGKDGLSAWQKKRAEERQYQQEIDRLQKENTQLRDRIQHLQSDPNAIEHQAREELHYAKPGEVIYTLPAPPQGQPAAPSK